MLRRSGRISGRGGVVRLLFEGKRGLEESITTEETRGPETESSKLDPPLRAAFGRGKKLGVVFSLLLERSDPLGGGPTCRR